MQPCYQATEQSTLLSTNTDNYDVQLNPTKPSSNQTINRRAKAITSAIIFLAFLLLLMTFILNRSTSSTATMFVTHNNHHISSDIRGGVDASGQDYPWMASWRFDGIHCCTGALINQDPPIVATAAHCVSCEQTTMDLRRTLTNVADNTAEAHDILYWIQHPSYETPSVSSNDIALVVLDGTTDINPIPMVSPKVSSFDVYPPQTPMDIFGYGFIDEADTIISTQLQQGVIYAKSKQECFTYLTTACDYGERWDGDAMLCGYDPNASTERGDSGGPAVMNGYLAGLNSWSPPSANCEAISGPDYEILDVFVDIGSVRHWVEDTKPTAETYFVGVHVCDDSIASEAGLSAILHGSSGKDSDSIQLGNELLTDALTANGFNVFVMRDIDNIGWAVGSVTLQAESADVLCIDMVVAGRLDGAELVTGATERFWMQETCLDGVTPCYTEYDLQLKKRCGSPGADGADDPVFSSIESNYYSVILHVCDPEVSPVGGTFDNVYARLHGVYRSSEWFELQNDAMDASFVSGGVFIFGVETAFDLGVNVASIEFQTDNNDALCIDTVTVGNARYPHLWKGSHEQFFIDNPCNVNPINDIECSELKMLQLTCYDF
eukprot:109813_1